MVALTDKGEDVEEFLRAVFDSSYFEPPPTPVVFPSLVGILRLAHKYDVNYLFKRALKHLEVFFPSCGVLPEPTAMQLYRRFTANGFTSWAQLVASTSPAGPAGPAARNNLVILKVLRQVGATWLLPAAYYFASLLSLDDLYTVPRDADWDEYDIVRCSRVRRFFSSHHATALVHFTTPADNAHCAQPALCILGRQMVLQLCLTAAARFPDRGLLSSWTSSPNSTEWRDVADAGYCPQCLAHSQDKVRAQCVVAWDGLPKKLELRTWPDLAALRHSVMDS
ncbi:hypothetical protein C8F01DRAFT_1276427 [Mycena amicta]|nr:hypothetical protein C8F01DRAFT_1276427 [Mycena amicta]